MKRLVGVAAVALALVALPASASAMGPGTVGPDVEEWHTWEITEGVLADDPQTADDVNWPQTYVGPGEILPTECGIWYQTDRYIGAEEHIDVVLEDGILTKGEDFHLAVEWRFTYGGDCEPEGLLPETGGAILWWLIPAGIAALIAGGLALRKRPNLG